MEYKSFYNKKSFTCFFKVHHMDLESDFVHAIINAYAWFGNNSQESFWCKPFLGPGVPFVC